MGKFRHAMANSEDTRADEMAQEEPFRQDIYCFSSVFLFVCSVVLHPSQQLWSCRDSQLTLPHFFLGKLATGLTSTLCTYFRL